RGEFASPESTRRFEREARAAGRLHHPNIVATHDYGVSREQAYLSMDWIPGPNLADLIRDRPFPPARAARCVRALAQAVDYAHAQGILHRDLKPSNVLVDPEDRPHLTDFGLAKCLGESLDLTLTGQPLGSPNYMAPEQAAGRHDLIGPTADIYALGAILYHCLTGRPPFLAATLTATLRQAQEAEPVSPRLLNPTVPRDLETLCLKCLEKLPARRFPTAGSLADELGRFLAGEPILSRPIGPGERSARWCRRHPGYTALGGTLALLMLAVGLLGSLALWQTERARVAESSERLQRQVVERQAEEQRRRLIRSYLDAGRRLAEASDPSGALLWYVEALTLSCNRPIEEAAHRMRIAATLEWCPRPEQILPHPAPVQLATFSRDGRRIVSICWDEPPEDGPGTLPGGQTTVWDLESGHPVFPPLPSTSQPHGSSGNKGIGIRYHPSSPGERLVFTVTATGDSVSNITSRIHIHDATSGARVGAPLVHDGLVAFAEFSPDERWIVSATARRLAGRVRAGEARVWEVATGRPIGPVLPHGSSVTAARFSPDGRRVLTACRDGLARLWEIPSGRLAFPPMEHRGPLLHATFDHSGRRLATAGTMPFEARIWDADSGKPVTGPLPHRDVEGDIYAVAFSPDDRSLLSFGVDGTARVWEVDSGHLRFPPLRHSKAVAGAGFSPDGRHLATASFGGELRLWNAQDGNPAGPLVVQGGILFAFSFAPDGRRLVTGSHNHLATVWRLEPAGPPAVVLRHSGWILDARFSGDGRRLVTASGDGTARVWNVHSGEPVTPPLVHSHRVVRAAWSPDGRRVATASLDWTARLWDAETGQPMGPPLLHSNAVWHVDFDPTGRRLVTASGGATWDPSSGRVNPTVRDGATFGEARIWDVETCASTVPPLRHERAVLQATFSPDGQRVLTGSSDGTARVWDANTGEPLLPPLPAAGMVGRARFSPDGTRILTSTAVADRGSGGNVSIWDARTGLRSVPDPEFPGHVYEAYFSPNGDRVAGCGLHHSIIAVADARTGRPSLPDIISPAAVADVAFSPDGRWLAGGGGDGVMRLWDTLDGEWIAGFQPHSNVVYRVAFSPDGQQLASCSWDGTVRIRNVPREKRPVADLGLLASLLSGRRIDAAGRMVPLDAPALTNAWMRMKGKYPADFVPRPAH
ncbi:MAG: protein kinase, partial [Verrucomicrobiales bacterium]|nr:protein kinase [Verrucomicrobiales bacterium]